MSRWRQRDFWLWCLSVIAVIMNAALGSANLESMVVTEKICQHNRQVITELITFQGNMVDAETGHRGYLLTGDKAYLEPYILGSQFANRHFDLLREMTQDNPQQQARLEALAQTKDRKFKEMHRTISIFDERGTSAALPEIRKGYGKVEMDQIRQLVAEALGAENRVLLEREEQARRQVRWAHLSIAVAGTLGIIVIVTASTLIRAELKRRLAANTSLVEAQRQLEATFHKVRESELRYRNLSDHLERLVQERTADLNTQSQRLRESNGELEKFAYIASHDLQEPLRKIQSFGDRLKRKQRDQLDDDGRESIDRMLDAAARMRRLIEDLLAFSRISSQVKPFQDVDLNELAGEVASTFAERIAAAGGRITIGPLPRIHGDETQLLQLFQNLLGNAIKFARPGVPPQVAVTAVSWDALAEDCDPPKPGTRGWRIAIADNGIGFEEQYSERIFELFQRLHGRTHYEGTGLGLAIVKKIATRHGVTVHVRAEPNAGATFFLDWPESAEKP